MGFLKLSLCSAGYQNVSKHCLRAKGVIIFANIRLLWDDFLSSVRIFLRFQTGMLPKKIDWPVLAQCDLYAVKVYVEKGFRIAEELVRPLSKRIFDQRVSDNLDWKKTYEVMCKAYESLSPDFVIENYNYGE